MHAYLNTSKCFVQITGDEMGLLKLHVLFAAAVCDECQVGEKQAGRQRGDFRRDNDKEDEERDQRT